MAKGLKFWMKDVEEFYNLKTEALISISVITTTVAVLQHCFVYVIKKMILYAVTSVFLQNPEI